jgi:hypothetical protein
MKYLATLALLLLLALPAHAADFPAIDGWELAGEVTAKTPDNLWEFNNGAAEAFLAYGFKGLRYADLKQGELVVTVEIYDMGAPVNAFGIYTMERSEDMERTTIGAEAALALPYQCLMLKDRNYIKLGPYMGELKRDTAEALLTALAESLPGGDGWPTELTLLPKKDQVAGSVGYTREAFLGMSALTEVVHGDYAGNGDSFQRFILLAGSGEERKTRWDALAAKWAATELKKHPVLWKEVPYRGLVGVILTDEGIFGVTGSASQKDLLKRLKPFLD